MLTDRAPFEYLYLSRRLLTDLVQQDEAARPSWRGSFDLPFHIGVRLERRAPDIGNLRDLAMRALGLVSDNTGSVSEPGAYIHDELDLHLGVFAPHMGWDGQVTCYRGECSTPDGDVLVALFGSASNLVGRRATDDTVEGFHPSDVTGLYALLDSAREQGDPEIDLDYRWDDSALSERARVERAAMFARQGTAGASRPLEFLARVFLHAEDVRIAGHPYHRVLVGAPLWVATPRPEPFPGKAWK